MKLFLLIVLTIGILSCSKQNEEKIEVTNIDQLTGQWQWVSTCGGIIGTCEYPSADRYAAINFGSNGKYVELHNGTVYLEADYIIIKINDTTGRLRLNSQKYEYSLSIVNNLLEIGRGELVDTYKKINYTMNGVTTFKVPSPKTQISRTKTYSINSFGI